MEGGAESHGHLGEEPSSSAPSFFAAPEPNSFVWPLVARQLLPSLRCWPALATHVTPGHGPGALRGPGLLLLGPRLSASGFSMPGSSASFRSLPSLRLPRDDVMTANPAAPRLPHSVSLTAVCAFLALCAWTSASQMERLSQLPLSSAHRTTPGVSEPTTQTC